MIGSIREKFWYKSLTVTLLAPYEEVSNVTFPNSELSDNQKKLFFSQCFGWSRRHGHNQSPHSSYSQKTPIPLLGVDCMFNLRGPMLAQSGQGSLLGQISSKPNNSGGLSPKYSNSSFPEDFGGGGRFGSRSENYWQIEFLKKRNREIIKTHVSLHHLL